jgi:hypothetical protein
MEAGEDFVRLVDHDEVERCTGCKEFGAAFASGKLPADHVHPWRDKVRLTLPRLNAEQMQQFVLPLCRFSAAGDARLSTR